MSTLVIVAGSIGLLAMFAYLIIELSADRKQGSHH